jgi:predicted N-acetyltransferase YhbS
LLRAATESDAPAVADLLTQLGYATTPAQAAARLRAVLDHADWVTLVAEEGAAPRRGVGAELVRALERRAAAAGAGKIVVTSATRRADAHAFYEKLGYERTGLRFGKSVVL